MIFIHAQASSTDSSAVIYTATEGVRVIRKGGTRTWRNNNPGNLRYTAFSRSHGAIGTAGGFAVFATAKAGELAISALLQGPTYSPLSIASAVARYAPPNENDTKNYEHLIAKLTGLDVTRKILDLDANELARVVAAIQTIEGFKVGTEIFVKRIVSTLSENKRLSYFLVQGESNPLALPEAIAQAKLGLLDAVVVRMQSGREYLRARPDGTNSNNFGALAVEQSDG